MIFLGDLKHVEGNIFKVGHVHYSPFSSSHGLGKTKSELEEIGVIVDALPSPENIEGKYSTLCYDKSLCQVVYRYNDIPQSQQSDIEKMQYDITTQFSVNNIMMDMVDAIYLKSQNNDIETLSYNPNSGVVEYIVYRCVNIFKNEGAFITKEYVDIMCANSINDKNSVIEILSSRYNINLL